MAGQAKALWNGGQTETYWDDIRAGVTHEDELDHVFGFSWTGDALVTITHFWDSDLGDADGVTNIIGTFQNAYQKTQSLWSLALGAYAKGDRHLAYHYFGHIVHLMGDATIPTHVHDDMHGPDWYDDDAYEEWMSVAGDALNGPLNARVTPAELAALQDAGPIAVPNVSNKLRWLLYTTNQIADFFASDDYDGDAIDAEGFVQAELNAMAATITRPRTQDYLHGDGGGGDLDNDDDNDNDDGDLGIIRQYSYLRGIRSIAALYQLWERTIRDQVSLAVVIDHVEEDEDHDYACLPICFETSDPDFYASVRIAGWPGQNRGDEIEDDEVVDPGWAFGHPVGVMGSVPVHVEIWDNDGAYDKFATLSGSDDQSDIDPTDEEDDLSLDLTVDLAKCLARQPGAITGEMSGACGDVLTSTGDADDEASQVRFRILMSKSPPVAEAGGPYTTDEGIDKELDGTASTDPDGDITTYAWDLDGDGDCDDVVNDSTPDFTAVGNDGSTTVKLCVTDATGLTDNDTATVTVNNVAPSIALSSNTPTGENTTTTVSATISDPGWLDSLSATIAWDGGTAQAVSGTTENARPDATLTFSADKTYGDNGTFSAQVCAADDDTTPCSTISLQVTNTSPTAAIDLSGAVSVNGTPTIIAHAGQSVPFSGRSTDPGSDDLMLTWAWGDGTSSSTTSLVNPPATDPAISPSVQPRDVTSPQSHTFGAACAYETTFRATDDDTGTASATANVIIVGNGHPNQPHGYWKQQFRYQVSGKGVSDFDSSQLDCYLRIVGYMSRIFNESTDASTFTRAIDVLETDQTSVINELFDQQLLAAWLDFANGAMEWNRMVDTNGDKTPDARFLDAITEAESLRLSPTATRRQLDRQKAIVERWTSLP
jgi:hypothetical protein